MYRWSCRFRASTNPDYSALVVTMMQEGSVCPAVCWLLCSRTWCGFPIHGKPGLSSASFSLQLPDVPLPVSETEANVTSAACVVTHFC